MARIKKSNTGNNTQKGSVKRLNNSDQMATKRLERKIAMRKRAKKKAAVKRAIAAAIITIILLISFVGIYLISFISSLNNNNIIQATSAKGSTPINILLLGMDIGDAENVANTSAKRTDTMMLLNYNPSTDKINLVSIPRDTLIEVEDAYDENGDYIPYWKINSAYALGGEDEVIYQVQNLLDITVNYLVEIDYAAFRNIIDAIGGVEMYIDRDMYYDDDAQDLHINFTAGETVLLDGKKAEEFFRWRKNNDGTGLVDGDLGRIQNQQKFISQLIKQCSNPLILADVPKVLNAIKENVSTNMPGTKMIYYGMKMIFNSGVSMSTLQGYDETIYGQDFLVVEPENNAEVISALKGEGASINDVNISKESYNIKVLNGTRINGLAGNLKNELENLGYENISVGNADATNKSSILCNDSELKKALSTETGINNLQKNKGDEYKDYDAVIIIGEDYLVFD